MICSTLLKDHLDWPDVEQVCQLTRRTFRHGKETVEVEYAITSVPREKANAERLLQWWRGHWHIENRLHWVRDATMGEDACRVRKGAAPQVLAALRNAAIHVLRTTGATNIAATLRQHALKVDSLFAKLGRFKE